MSQIATRLHIIWVLTWLKFLPRTRRESAKLFWIFAEPAGQLAVLIVIFTYIGRSPAYGTSMALFLMTGIVMLNFFSVGSQMIMRSMLQTSNRVRLSPIGLFHDALASVIFKTITAMGYTLVLLIGIAAVQNISIIPHHPLRVIEAFVTCGVLCLGVGLLRGYATRYMPVIERIYGTLTRGMIFISGVFYVPSFLPPQVRDLLYYNPVLHVVELYRLGVYDQYPTIVYDATYLRLFVLVTIALGFTLIWRNRASFTE